MTTETSTSGYKRIQRGKAHWYRRPDGSKLPGVTTVCHVIANERFISSAARKVAAWAGDNGSSFGDMTPSQITKAGEDHYFAHRFDAAERGRTIHEHAADLLAGREVTIAEGDERIVDTFLRMADEWQLDPEAVERPLVSCRRGPAWDYMGTFDFLGRAKGQPALLDWKTGASGVWPETALQLAAYRDADFYIRSDGTEAPMRAAYLVAAVWLQDDRYDVVPVDAGPETLRSFLACRALYEWTQRERADVVGEPLKEVAP